MRLAFVLAGSILFGCATAAAEPAKRSARPARSRAARFDARPLDVLLAEAGRTGRRVVVDFHAPW